MICYTDGCPNLVQGSGTICDTCLLTTGVSKPSTSTSRRKGDIPMSERYPKYYKPVPVGADSLDIYAVCAMFNVQDAALSHALKKIMLPGVRTGGKTRTDDIKEARDTLNRWLELNAG